MQLTILHPNWFTRAEDAAIKALIVVAHPDDEVLGFGAAGFSIAAAGGAVRTCILSAGARARTQRPETDALIADTLRAQEVLGFGQPFLGDFPNIALNAVPHLSLVQFIEAALVESGATTIVTHHFRDLNNDHLQVSLASQAASRLSFRRADIPPVNSLLFMETVSSTDWSVRDGRAPFDPDTFIPVSEEAVEKKIKALLCYRGVARPRPHSRNAEIVRAQAALRGSESGNMWAEAFQTGFHILKVASE